MSNTWKQSVRRLARILVLASFISSSVISPVLAGPTGGRIVSGNGSISQNGNNSRIDQATDRLIIEWDSFNTTAQEQVRFHQPSSDASVLNRVLSGHATVFDGSLFANGNVIIVNGAGIHFGPNSRVDVGSLIASTAGISNSNFLDNRLIFDRPGLPDAMVTNAGMITVRDTGLAALVAPGVENSGLIRANLGTVILGAGEAHTIDFNGDGLVAFTITEPTKTAPKRRDGSTAEALASNSGTVEADGGSIVMTASQASRVLDNAINMSGVAQANSVGVRNGKIVLFGGDKGRVKVGGRVRANGARKGETGGTIHITGEEIPIPKSRIEALGEAGGGEVLIGGALKGGPLDDGSAIGYLRDGDLVSILTGEDAGAAGNGFIPTSDIVHVGADASIDASALDSGGGGTVIVWGDKTAVFEGFIAARGGANGGDGGFAEVSSAHVTVSGTFDLSAAAGQSGRVLIDPTNLCVATDSINCGNDFSFVDVVTIVSTLESGTDFTLDTSNPPIGVSGPTNQDGNVEIVDAIAVDFANNISPDDDAVFTVLADAGIVQNAKVSGVNGALGIDYQAKTAEGRITVNDDIAANNGDIVFDAPTVDLDGNLTADNISGTAMTVNVLSNAAEIQDAVDVAAAGAIVNVGDGTFAGGIVIDKALTLIGDGPTNTTVIDVPGNSAGLTVISSNVTIDGLRFERDGDVDDTIGILLDGRFATNGAISDILIGDTAGDADAIGNYFVDRLDVGIEALGDVDTVEISDNTFGIDGGNADIDNDPDRIKTGIRSRVERLGGPTKPNRIIDGNGDVIGSGQGPFSDWLITNNSFAIRSPNRGTAIDLEGPSGSVVDAFKITNNVILSAFAGMHIVGGGGSNSPHPISNNILIDNNTITGLASRGHGIRVGANLDRLSANNDRSRMANINISSNTINNTDIGIDVSGVTKMTMADIVVDGNTVNNADDIGIRLLIDGRLRNGDPDWTGFVISNNDVNLGVNGIGLLIDVRLNSSLAIGTGNSFDGGVDGIVIDGRSGRTLTLVGNTLNNTEFTNQSGNYIELQDTALFDPGDPTVIDATGVSFDGLDPAVAADAIAIENKIVHYLDDDTLGLINFGSIVVGSPTLDASIQRAVNLAGATGIGTVVVPSGTYGGSVEVWVDNLTLIGQGATTIINTDAVDLFANNGDVDNGFQVAAISGLSGGGTVTGVTIDGFAFDTVSTSGQNIGVELGELSPARIAENTTLQNNIFNDLLDGVISRNTIGTTTFTGNTMTDIAQQGIAFLDSTIAGETINVTGNVITSTDRSLLFGSSVQNSNVVVQGNTFDSGTEAINFFAGASNSTVLIGGDSSAEANDLFGTNRGIFTSTLDGGSFTVANNTRIVGGTDAFSVGLFFNGPVRNGANVEILGNSLIEGNFSGIGSIAPFESSTVTIAGNTQINGRTAFGVSFGGNVTDSNITIGPATATVDGTSLSFGGNTIDGARDGINQFTGLHIDGTSVVNVTGNTITGGESGIGLASIRGNAQVNVTDNVSITGRTFDGIFFRSASFSDAITDNAILTIARNAITGGRDGIAFARIFGNAQVNVTDNISITGANGIAFNRAVATTNANGVRIIGNPLIHGTIGDGIVFKDTITNSTVVIAGNESIFGHQSGIEVGAINDGTVTIANNNNIRSDSLAALFFQGAITNQAALTVLGNGTIQGDRSSSVLFERTITDSSVVIGNNTQIRGGLGEGIAFARDVRSSTIVIAGNEGIFGDGTDAIFFDGGVIDSDVTIGAATVTVNGQSTSFGGNRLLFGAEDGINFSNGVEGDTELTIIDNVIGSAGSRVGEDGIRFDGVLDTATVTIDANQVFATQKAIRINFLQSPSTVSIVGGTYDGTGGALLVDNTLFPFPGPDGRLNLGAAAYIAGAGSTVFEVLTDAGNAGVEVDFNGAASFTGGETGMRLTGPGVSIVGNRLGTIAFSGQTGNFIELTDGALFEPGRPTIIFGNDAIYDGVSIPLGASAPLLSWVESRIIDFDDNPTLGQIFFLPSPPVDGLPEFGVRSTNAQTPGDRILRPEYVFEILANGIFGQRYGLGRCAVLVDAGNPEGRVVCVAPVSGSDISPWLDRYLSNLDL